MENNSNTSKIICRRLRKGLHFCTTELRACCAKVPGPVYSKLENMHNIDWYSIIKVRQNLIQQFEENKIPECCKGCPDSSGFISFLDKEGNGKNNNKIDLIQINHFYACNAACIYCANKPDPDFEKRIKPQYEILPILKDLENKNLLEEKFDILFTGGEPTCFQELDKIISFFRNRDCTYHIFTSGIDYKEVFEELFAENRVMMLLSLDSGCKQTYKKIKRVDKFDKIINNLKQYIKKVPIAANQIRMKYIFLEGINDNKKEIEKFLKLVKKLKIVNVEISIDWSKKYTDIKYPVPKHYYDLFIFFKQLSEKLGLNVIMPPMISMIVQSGIIT